MSVSASDRGRAPTTSWRAPPPEPPRMLLLLLPHCCHRRPRGTQGSRVYATGKPNAPVAQGTEQRTSNPPAAGSNPAGRAYINGRFAGKMLLLWEGHWRSGLSVHQQIHQHAGKRREGEDMHLRGYPLENVEPLDPNLTPSHGREGDGT